MNPPQVAIQYQGRIPDFTIGDRLRKAREYAGFDGPGGVERFAEFLGVHRNLPGRYENDRASTDSRAFQRMLRQWSLATGVDLNWLLTGEEPGPAPTDGGERVPSSGEKPAGARKRRSPAGGPNSSWCSAPAAGGGRFALCRSSARSGNPPMGSVFSVCRLAA